VQFFMHVDGFPTPPNILKPQTIETMTTASAANAGYAKGWEVNKANNWWHNGFLPGTSTIAVRTHTAGFAGQRSQIRGRIRRWIATSICSIGTWCGRLKAGKFK
jgi:hypothetical protein